MTCSEISCRSIAVCAAICIGACSGQSALTSAPPSEAIDMSCDEADVREYVHILQQHISSNWVAPKVWSQAVGFECLVVIN